MAEALYLVDVNLLIARLFEGHEHHDIATDAYLLGMAIEDDLILATFDKRLGHLAGEHAKHVLILGA